MYYDKPSKLLQCIIFIQKKKEFTIFSKINYFYFNVILFPNFNEYIQTSLFINLKPAIRDHLPLVASLSLPKSLLLSY